MQLDIITPDDIIFSGNVSSVTVPGTKGRFTILNNHAPIISSLSAGVISYRVGDEEFHVESAGGFVELKKNQIAIAIEVSGEQNR